MITYREEKFNDIIEEMMPILEQHYSEIAMYQDKIEFIPDLDFYNLAQDVTCYITARDDEKLVGYSVYFVKAHPHYKEDIYAANDILYIDKDYRNGSVSVEMLSFAETTLKNKGVSVITMHMKNYAPFERLMATLNFDTAETIFTKYIKD